MKESNEFKIQVLRALKDQKITRDETKVLFLKGNNETDIFLFEDDMTETDYLIKSGLEKMGFYGGIILDGSSESVFSHGANNDY